MRTRNRVALFWKLPDRVFPKSILTKDNIARKTEKAARNVFVVIGMRLFNTYSWIAPVAKVIWRIIFFATNLNQPISINHMFGT